MIPFGLGSFQYTYQITPIILTGGVAANMPGGMLPIVNITESANYPSPLSSAGAVALNDFFAQYQPVAGGTLVDQDVGTYPFANQSTAANAVITKPLSVSLLMICPARGAGSYWNKLAVLNALQQTLQQHNISGGTYAILTPAAYWFNCVMLAMRDVSGDATKQVQFMYQLDFIKPLVTLADAAAAQNTLLSKISSGTQVTNTAWSGSPSSVGYPPSGVAPSVVPATQASPGAGPSLST